MICSRFLRISKYIKNLNLNTPGVYCLYLYILCFIGSHSKNYKENQKLTSIHQLDLSFYKMLYCRFLIGSKFLVVEKLFTDEKKKLIVKPIHISLRSESKIVPISI